MKLLFIFIGCLSIFLFSSLVNDKWLKREKNVENFLNWKKKGKQIKFGAKRILNSKTTTDILSQIKMNKINLESLNKVIYSVKDGFNAFSDEIGSVIGTFQDLTKEDKDIFENARSVLYDKLSNMNSTQKTKLRFAILKEFSLKPTEQQQKDAKSDEYSDDATNNELIKKNIKILRFVMLHKNFSNNNVPEKNISFGRKAIDYTSVVNKEMINFFSVPQKETQELKMDLNTLNNINEQIFYDTVIQFRNDFTKKKGNDQVDIKETPIKKEWLRMFPEDRAYSDTQLLSSIRMHMGVFVSILEDIEEKD
jgi:hypothetical protein